LDGKKLILVKGLTFQPWEGSGYGFTHPSMELQMITFQVNDMTCGHCVSTVTKAVKGLDATAQVDIDLAAHKVKVESARPAGEVAAAIREAGFTPEPLA
jgi:copper chaperone